MTSVDVAAPAAINLQDPTVGRTELVSDPGTGPDGRTLDDNLTGRPHKLAETPSKEKQSGGSHTVDEDKKATADNVNTPADVGDTKEDIDKDVKQDNVTKTTNQHSDEKTVSDNKNMGVAKVTEYRSKLETVNGINDKGKFGEMDNGKTDSSERVVDIVKQSKLKNAPKANHSSDLGDYLPEFPQSRPLTETSHRDGTRMSYDVNENHRREVKSESDRELKTPFSVTIGRKPLHTAQTRSHSDYFSKSPSTSRYTYIAAVAQQNGFQPEMMMSDTYFRNYNPHQSVQRVRRPPKLVRLATVTMSPKQKKLRTKPAPRGPSLYYEEPKKPQKVITWDEANEARPPLRIDMEGPGPTNYSPINKPLNETNAPAWTFGSKCFIEKSGGSRTSWEKTWFQSPDVWTSKVDYYSDSAWPNPVQYKQRPTLGPRQRTMYEPPSFTIGVRKEMVLSKKGSDKEPSPVDYDKDTADKLTMRQAPSFSHQFRREGTVIWPAKGKVPGPGAYSPKYSYNHPHGPSFSIRSLRREKSHVLGPFSTF